MNINLDNIYDIFDNDVLNNLDKENVIKIITYLKINNINFIDDILNNYIDLLNIPYNTFIDKFNNLIHKYGINKIEEDLNILEEMY